MEDTICAISTSIGIGAISIVRISGNNAIKIVNSIFSSKITTDDNRKIKYGYIKDGKEIIDEVLVMVMLAPKTYTKEDIIEINCHGGYNTTNKILELLLQKGARLAEPGEFTKRAYLNGRINLLESEAVNELIKATTDSKRKLCLNQIGGNLTKIIEDIREDLVSLMANIEVNIDYPEYTDNLVITEKLLKDKLNNTIKKLKKLVDETKYGKIVSNGINVAIIGKPNVGKSSILNHLLDEDKAIVTDIAGTTRDLVEGTFSLKGIEVKLVDTAGIHETNDIVEKIGVQKSIDTAKNADVVLLVLDGSNNLTKEDEKLIKENKNAIIFINKSDLNAKIKIDNAVYGNTKNVNGLDNLKEKLIEMFEINNINKDLTYLSNARQIELVTKAYKSLEKAQSSLDKKIPIDMIENDLKYAFEHLGSIIGKNYEDEVIDRLFKDFCVGK